MLVFDTQMHIVTFAFTILELVAAFYMIIAFLARPNDKKRQYYLLLLTFVIVYNITGGLFPDPFIPIPVLIQNILAYGAGFAMCMFAPYYFYTVFELERMRFHALYGIFLFLLLPFLLCFLIVYPVTKDLNQVRTYSVIVPFFYALSIIWAMSRCVMEKWAKMNTWERREMVWVCLAISSWISLTIVTFFNAPQYIEVLIVNLGIVIVSGLYIKRDIVITRAEEYLRGMQELRIRLSQEKNDTFASIAHESKTPLTLLNNYLEETLGKYPQMQEIKMLQKHIKALTDEMVSFLDMDKIEKGDLSYDHKKVCHFSEVLLSLVELYKATKPFDFQLQIKQEIISNADPIAIRRLYTNIIENAVRNSPPDSTIRIYLYQEERYIIFYVEDEGTGIPIEVQKKIFEPYISIPSEYNKSYGHGLGLKAVKDIVESLQGEIKIYSDLSIKKGTKFLVKVPKIEEWFNEKDVVEESILRDNLKMLSNQEYNPTHKTVLLIEDNSELREYLFKQLCEFYNCYAAVSGEQAVTILKTQPMPDIIISDVIMPGMGGLNFVKYIQEQTMYNHIGILLISAKSDMKQQGLDLGVLDYIEKPFLINDLLLKINAILSLQEKKQKYFVDSLLFSLLETSKHQSYSFIEPFPQTIDLALIKHNAQLYSLTPREHKVLELLCAEKSSTEIGNQLYVSPKTVENHTANIYKKVGVRTRHQLIEKLGK